jgi:hypothetical protein
MAKIKKKHQRDIIPALQLDKFPVKKNSESVSREI